MSFRSKISWSKLAVTELIRRSNGHSLSRQSDISEQSPVLGAQTANPSHADITTPNTDSAALRVSLGQLKDICSSTPHLCSAINDLLEFSNAIEKEGTSNGEIRLAEELQQLCISVTERLVKQGHNASSCMYEPITAMKQRGQETEAEDQGLETGQQIHREQESGVKTTERIWHAVDLLRGLKACVYFPIMGYRLHIMQNRQESLEANEQVHIHREQIVANTLEKILCPAKKAIYNSFMSSTVGRRACTQGTRIEILLSLDKWLYNSIGPQTCWISGMEGTGKTTIAYTFCKRVERQGLLAASFFFTRTSSECRDTARMIPTIAYQLARYSGPFRLALYNTLIEGAEVHSTSLEVQWERLLRGPLQKVQGAALDGAVVVIDGLNECGDDNSDDNDANNISGLLLRCFANLPLKLLISTQSMPRIWTDATQENTQCEKLDLETAQATGLGTDISQLFKEELSCLPLSPDQLRQLVLQSNLRFKHAAYITSMINSGERRSDRYQRMLSMVTMEPEDIARDAQVDALCRAGLACMQNAGWKNSNTEQFIQALVYLTLFAREPISVDTVAEIYNISDVRRVCRVLRPLLSVLRRVNGNKLALASNEPSPPSTMTNNIPTEQLGYTQRNQQLAERCFRTMEQQLRFNICDLPSSCVPNRDVTDLQDRIKRNISPALSYACRRWGDHLAVLPHSNILQTLLQELLSVRLLFWLEALSLRDELGIGIEALRKANDWLVKQSNPQSFNLALLLDDSLRFVTGYASSRAAESTPHIYISWLPLWPKSSLVYKYYWHRMQGLLMFKGDVMDLTQISSWLTWKIGSNVLSVVFSPDGSRVAVGCDDGTVGIRNAYDGTLLVGPWQAHRYGARSVEFSPDGRLLASGSYDRTIMLWDVHTGILVTGPLRAHTDRVMSVSFSPDRKHMVSGSEDKALCIWNTVNGTLFLGPLHGHTGPVLSVAYSPDGSLIASASADNTIRLWRPDDGTLAASPLTGHIDSVKSIAFTPDGTRLV
ncbi:WD40 repeat-like protein, partial [Rhizoctonia solani]